MCTYNKVLLACGHPIYGSRVSICSRGPSCTIQESHAFKTHRVKDMCERCASLADTFAAVRASIARCRKMVRERSERSGSVRSEGSDVDADVDDKVSLDKGLANRGVETK